MQKVKHRSAVFDAAKQTEAAVQILEAQGGVDAVAVGARSLLEIHGEGPTKWSFEISGVAANVELRFTFCETQSNA